MAAFSSLALLGLGLAGGFAANKLANRKAGPQQSVTAQQPTPQGIEPMTPPPAPAPAAQTTSTATKSAAAAGTRARRRGTGPRAGGATTQAGQNNPGAILQPTSILGF